MRQQQPRSRSDPEGANTGAMLAKPSAANTSLRQVRRQFDGKPIKWRGVDTCKSRHGR